MTHLDRRPQLPLQPGPPALRLSPAQRSFERKVKWSKAALILEAAWPQLWVLAGLAFAFVAVSMLGVWPALPELAHKALLGAFALGALAVLVLLLRLRAPSREEAIRRIERRSGLPHRPASTYEDTVTSAASDPVARRIWAAHRIRLAEAMARLRVGPPSPRTDRRDPLALRALALIGAFTLTVLAGDAASDRLAAAFRFGPLARGIDARLDAWVTPPAYTGAAPVMLADGSRGLAGLHLQSGEPPSIPINSTLYVRSSGGIPKLALEIVPDASAGQPLAKPQRIELPQPEGGKVDVAAVDSGELKAELKFGGTIRVLSGTSELVAWPFRIIPDNPPVVSFSRDTERTLHGGLRVFYKVADDYGVAALEGHVTRLREKADTSANAWARPQKAKGPRPPYERPPVLAMRLAQSYPKSITGFSLNEIGDHVWAGLPVTLTLVARDGANQVGKTEARKMVLPARQFYKPLARAVVEQRRDLADDPRQRQHVLDALDALTLAPESSIKDLGVYLGLRSAYWRLLHDTSRAARNSVIGQLWQIALRIEDGALSDAERALKDAQDKLSKALENGASDEEIRQLMSELRQAMSEYMKELSRRAENAPPMDTQNMDPNQMLSQQDLEQMMQNLENMARSGQKDMAQQLLSELRDLMDRLQSGRMAQGQGGQGQGEGQKLMGQLGELLGKQQQLLDDTFKNQQQGQQGDGQDGDGQQQGQQGQQGQGSPGQRGQQGQRGQRGQRGQQGQQGQQGEQGGQSSGESLGNREGGLRGMLDQLQRGLAQNGLQPPGEFGDAGKAMREAEDALKRGDLQGGADAEQRALDALRKGARQMAEQMMQNMGRRAGNGTAPPRGPIDPLGRPQSTPDGFDPGQTVKVPDQIDVQRAREILEELRKRLGETNRPTYELDYLERLLKQF